MTFPDSRHLPIVYTPRVPREVVPAVNLQPLIIAQMMLTNMLNLSHMLTMYLFMTARIVQMMLNCIFTTAKNNANDANGGKQMLSAIVQPAK